MQQNLYTKTINGDRPTEHRLEWTVEGLNVFLPVYRDLHELKIAKTDAGPKFVAGTMEDVDRLHLLIHKKVGVVLPGWVVPWNASVWYDEPQEWEVEKDGWRPSVKLELSHKYVIDTYYRLQNNVWDNAEDFEILGDKTYELAPDLESSEDDTMDIDDEATPNINLRRQPAVRRNNKRTAKRKNNNNSEQEKIDSEHEEIDSEHEEIDSEHEEIDMPGIMQAIQNFEYELEDIDANDASSERDDDAEIDEIDLDDF